MSSPTKWWWWWLFTLTGMCTVFTMVFVWKCVWCFTGTWMRILQQWKTKYSSFQLFTLQTIDNYARLLRCTASCIACKESYQNDGYSDTSKDLRMICAKRKQKHVWIWVIEQVTNGKHKTENKTGAAINLSFLCIFQQLFCIKNFKHDASTIQMVSIGLVKFLWHTRCAPQSANWQKTVFPIVFSLPVCFVDHFGKLKTLGQ